MSVGGEEGAGVGWVGFAGVGDWRGESKRSIVGEVGHTSFTKNK